LVPHFLDESYAPDLKLISGKLSLFSGTFPSDRQMNIEFVVILCRLKVHLSIFHLCWYPKL